MRYIQILSNSGDVQTALDAQELGKPYVAYLEDEHRIDWNSRYINYAGMPLTFNITGDGNINVGNSVGSMEYSLNGSNWTAAQGLTISVHTGDKIRFRIHNWDKYYRAFKDSTASFVAYGNPNYNNQNIDSLDHREMFKGCTGLTDASNLILAATSLQNQCYGSMFSGCTSLTAAPALPATTLANNCYNGMFAGCTGLTAAPELPATTLAAGCYGSMFAGCTSLTTAPELPATTLANRCYNGMFDGCTSLNYIKCLATDVSANRCTEGWLSRVASSGTFVKNPNMSSWTTGTDGIPSNWTVQDATV